MLGAGVRLMLWAALAGWVQVPNSSLSGRQEAAGGQAGRQHLQADKGGDARGQKAAQLLLSHVARAAAAGLHKGVAPQQDAPRDEPVGKVGKGAGGLIAGCRMGRPKGQRKMENYRDEA